MGNGGVDNPLGIRFLATSTYYQMMKEKQYLNSNGTLPAYQHPLKGGVTQRYHYDEYMKKIRDLDNGEFVLYADALAEKESALETQREEWRDNKRYLENDLARLFEEGIAIMHDQGAENILQKEEIAALRSVNEGLTEESISMKNSIKCLEKINAALRAKVEKAKSILAMGNTVRERDAWKTLKETDHD